MTAVIIVSLWIVTLIVLLVARCHYAKQMKRWLYGGPRYCAALDQWNSWVLCSRGFWLYSLTYILGQVWGIWAAHGGFLATSGYLIWLVTKHAKDVETCEAYGEHRAAEVVRAAPKQREPWVPTHTLYIESSSGDLVMLRDGAYWTRNEWRTGARPLFIEKNGRVCTHLGDATNIKAHPLPAAHSEIWRKIAAEGE